METCGEVHRGPQRLRVLFGSSSCCVLCLHDLIRSSPAQRELLIDPLENSSRGLFSFSQLRNKYATSCDSLQRMSLEAVVRRSTVEQFHINKTFSWNPWNIMDEMNWTPEQWDKASFTWTKLSMRLPVRHKHLEQMLCVYTFFPRSSTS